ncbi:MAG: cell wall hydrolase [Clostridia bacterium]|nr:cell wall hydrolase [Clostridia bacterium]
MSLLLLTLIGCLVLVTPASAAVTSPYKEQTVRTLHTVSERSVNAYPRIRVHTAGGAVIDGRLIGDTTYVALRAFGDAYGGTVSYRSDTRTATVRADGLTLTASDGGYVVYANGRTLFADTPCVILSDGRMYAPVRTMAKAYGLTVEWQASTRTVRLHGTMTPLADASVYYRADDVYWLSRIISAESGGEPLLGQIAVGCVVLNRRDSADFPSTIWGVIFDRTYGTQFTPAATGTVYRTPSAQSVLAAKICLEGYSLDGDILFFLEPNKSTSSWIPRSRRYCFSIGHHDFYA